MTTASACMKLIPPLVESLDRLPLHKKSLEVLEAKLKSQPSKQFMLSLARLISDYEKSRGRAAVERRQLESLIYHTHFVWSTPRPAHLQLFRKHYTEVVAFWPYEHHRAILSMKKPKTTSLRYRWDDSSAAVLSMMRYTRNPWCDQEPHGGGLTSLQRELLFNAIFAHYLFLKQNPRLCKNGRKLPIPIVEIPMRPLGNDIAAVRIKNLFKRKVSSIYNILAVDNPMLSRESEALLCSIIQDSPTRKQARLYQAACRRAYVMENDHGPDYEDFQLPRFAPSSLLLHSI
ncbi:hypothetical protein HG536_0C01880 [Torulaspora globosa]|uniref:Genetic interactor of prohibitin 5, mitochondrial n=1 Tax=Torulaspora globosa TaxID=48254 RepID=A0A7G3ZET4_9SACH|nr:uncharacterized protein HG536_0C01880 [Torulaspora globosa]QLL32020.1 hypothetical protein HG536_0C01880 [Torulaspora globosa]